MHVDDGAVADLLTLTSQDEVVGGRWEKEVRKKERRSRDRDLLSTHPLRVKHRSWHCGYTLWISSHNL